MQVKVQHYMKLDRGDHHVLQTKCLNLEDLSISTGSF